MKIDTNQADLYIWNKPEIYERTKARLTEMSDLGMVDVGVANFGIPGVMSGLYIEKVWNYDEENWKGYMDWVRTMVASKKNS